MSRFCPPDRLCVDQPQRLIDFAVESLESRQMLSGNVNVIQTATGDIRITGDNGANQVSITADANGDLRVEGLGTTTINGDPSTTLSLATANTVERNLVLNMRGGVDEVTMLGIGVNGNASVNLGTGLEGLFELFDFAVGDIGGNMTIRSGSGWNEVQVEAGQIGGNLQVRLNGGFTRFITDDLHVSQRLVATAGSGMDFMQLATTTILGDAMVRLGGGEDIVGIIDSTASAWKLNAGAEQDHLAFLHATGDMDVRMGSGDDTVWGAACSVIGESRWNLGSGSDRVLFENEFVSDTSVIGGGQEDTVVFVGATLGGDLSVSLGGANDIIGITTTTTLSTGTISGGGSNDVLALANGLVVPPAVEFVSFEADLPVVDADLDPFVTFIKTEVATRWMDLGGPLMILVC